MRAFLDASVFLWALERPESNSARIVRLALAGKLEAVVDDGVLSEVDRFLRAHRGRAFAWLYAQQIRRIATVVAEADCAPELVKLRSTLKRNDRLHLAAARTAKAKVLIAFDEDFAPFPEYLTPKAAARRLGLRVSATDW